MQGVFHLFFVHGHDSGQLITSLHRARTLRLPWKAVTEFPQSEHSALKELRLRAWKEKDARWKWQLQNDIGTTRRCQNGQSLRWVTVTSFLTKLTFVWKLICADILFIVSITRDGFTTMRSGKLLAQWSSSTCRFCNYLEDITKISEKHPPKKCDWSKHFVDGLWHVGIWIKKAFGPNHGKGVFQDNALQVVAALKT